MRTASAFLPIALGLGVGLAAPIADYTSLDERGDLLRTQFNADVGKVRVLMLVAATCGGCLRGSAETQKYLLDKTDSPDLAAYVVWVPKNGAREEHMERVTGIVTDDRAWQYWDAHEAVMQPYHERYSLTGPCAGIFMVFGPEAQWGDDGPPAPDYAEDAHARQFDRQLPQWDGKRFAKYVLEMLK